jgi:hypothetical protein
MFWQDVEGKFWHRGTKLGLIYMLIAVLASLALTVEPTDAAYEWLGML